METKAGCRETAFWRHINGFLCTIKRKPGQAVNSVSRNCTAGLCLTIEGSQRIHLLFMTIECSQGVHSIVYVHTFITDSSSFKHNYTLIL